MKYYILTAFALFLFWAFPISAGSEHLLITDVQIAGEKTSNDFIKIYNPAGYELNVAGHKLRKRTSAGSESSIRVFPEDSKIPAGGYFIWANSSEDYHIAVGANVWSSAMLAKNNSIALLDKDGVILDSLAWGDNQNLFVGGTAFPENPDASQILTRKQTAGIYQNSDNNSQDFFLSSPVPQQAPPPPPQEAPAPQSEPTPTPEPASEVKPTEIQPDIEAPEPVFVYPSGVVINEILPYPDGLDMEREWFEIFNQNNFEVNLSGWKAADVAGTITTYTFPEGTKINPQSFMIISRPVSKITLNNDGDGLKLFNPDNQTADSTNYEKALREQSYNRTKTGDWEWSSSLTPGSANIIFEKAPEGPARHLPEAKPMVGGQNELASISEPLSPSRQTPQPLPVILVSLLLAFFSGITVLLLKKKTIVNIMK